MKCFINIFVFLLSATIMAISCKEEYDPQVDGVQNGHLVVEGILNNGGLTAIRLSRTRSLNEVLEKPELKALVSVENESGQSYRLTEDNGEYTIQLNLNNAEKYRLRIITADGREYLSDYVPVKSTPSIDEVTWKKKEDGLHIYVSTHDPQNDTRYYRWGFEETWIKEVDYVSYYEYVNGTVKPRSTPTHKVCYDTYIEEPLVLASTVKLSEDVISQAPVRLIPLGSAKLATKYSVLVKQYALDQKAYEYWQAMKKNTEQLGSIFDPQPSYMYGNIRSVTDPEEMVIGYFGACNITEKRIFITRTEADWIYIRKPPPPPGGAPLPDPCEIRTVSKHPDSLARYFGSQLGQLRWVPLTDADTRYTAVQEFYCADCGPNYIKPDWWR